MEQEWDMKNENIRFSSKIERPLLILVISDEIKCYLISWQSYLMHYEIKKSTTGDNNLCTKICTKSYVVIHMVIGGNTHAISHAN